MSDEPSSLPSSSARKIRFKTLGLMILIVPAVVFFIDSHFRNETSFNKNSLKVPDLKLVKASNRKPMKEALKTSLAPLEAEALEGKVVLLTFWAQWCWPCRAEFPLLNQLAQDLGGEPLTILAVNADESEAGVTKARNYFKEAGFSFRSLYNSNETIMERLDVQVLPTHILLDKKGRLAARWLGGTRWDAKEVKDFLKKLLSEPWEKQSS